MKTIKIFTSLIILNLLSACASYEHSVKIIDANTKAPLSNAYVYLGENLYLSDDEGRVEAKSDDNYVYVYAGKEGYFFGNKRFKASSAPTRNGVIFSNLELYPFPDYPKRLSRTFSFPPSKDFTQSHIDNTPNMKEFLTYLLKHNVSVYNFSANPNFENFILNVRAYETKEPLANCYVIISKRATMFSPQKDYLFMTNAEGYVDIPIKDYDKIFLAKEGYGYMSHSNYYSEKLQKERTVNLSLYSKDKRPPYLKDDCLKIADTLLSEYPRNKDLQALLAYLGSIDVIIATLPSNEIVDIESLKIHLP